MLGKLLKYELKQTFRFIFVIYIVLASIAAFLLISSLVGLTSLKILSYVLLFLAMITMSAMTLAAIVRNFRETLYGRQGYLSFTLPVKCSSLLMSKVLVSIFWLICMVLIEVAVYVIMIVAAMGENGVEILGSLKEMIEEMGINEILPSKGVIALVAFLIALRVLVTFVTLIGFLFFSITLANTRSLQDHPIVFGALIFLGSYIICNILSNIMTTYLPPIILYDGEKISLAFTSLINSETMFSYGIAGDLFMFIVAVVMLVATGKIMENKVNVK